MNILRSFFLFCILIGGTPTYSSEAILLFDKSEISLDSSVYTLKTKTPMEVLNVIDPQFLASFQPYKNPTYQFGYSTQWIWQTFQLYNPDHLNKKMVLLTQSASIYHYDLFVVDIETRELIKMVQTGYARPFVQRDVKHRFFVFSIEVPAHKKYQVVTRVHNEAGNLIQPLRLFNEKGFQDFQQGNNLLIASLLSLWTLGCIVSLFLFFSFFEKIYYYYSFYLLGILFYMASYEGITFQYLWPNSVFMADLSRMFYIPTIIYLFAFVYRILRTESNKLIVVKRIGLALTVLTLGFAAICCIPTDILPQRNYFTMVMNFFVLALLLLTWYALIVKLCEKYKPAYLLTIAFSPGILYGIILIANYWGLISISKNNSLTQYGLSICTVLEMGILLWMLLFRFRNIQRLQKLSAERMRLYSRLAAKTEKEEKEGPSYVNSKYNKQEIDELYQGIIVIMEAEKPYLDPELNLNRLAQLVNSHPNMLSQCINQMEGKNFNDFVNQYRMKKALGMLSDDKYYNFSVEGIGLEAGFSSKTTFYTAFKKYTGHTPTEYRKSSKKEEL